MESYRDIWNNFFNYLKEHWKIKNFEKIESCHVEAYMLYKIEYYPSLQYVQKISAALGKLEIALKYFTQNIYGQAKEYDFTVRKNIVNNSRNLELIADNYHNRAYKNPKRVIENLTNKKHKIAASIQLEGGARIEGISYIKKDQLFGYKSDEITNTNKGIIFTKEKGGKEGDVLVSEDTYKKLQDYIKLHGSFRIKREKYYKDIISACKIAGEIPEGSHAFRWNFAKRRMFEYAIANYGYQESLLGVSKEMKHNRARITEHYLG